MPRKKSGSEQTTKAGRGAPTLVAITGLSGSGKATVLNTLEDNGYYTVDNLPVELIGKFTELALGPNSAHQRAAIIVDIREGESLKQFPAVFSRLRNQVKASLLFLDADDETLVRRYSETRRPHPARYGSNVLESVRHERKLLEPIRAIADHVLSTSEMNVHQLRRRIVELYASPEEASLRTSVISFGYRHGVPQEADLVFDVRFLPNPNYVPELKLLTGRNPRVAKYIRQFPQSQEFLTRLSAMLFFLLPHYIREGKSYLTIAFGCTGGHHRSVMMAEEIAKMIQQSGYPVQLTHRDIRK
ncbi:MAG: RNase adapter RapZ [Bryobacteraceae bacterium]|jgi:UPF0042 nucleotide-binding protein|nr:RNase adapter RapZ [Bryobacteraceae bacterium]